MFAFFRISGSFLQVPSRSFAFIRIFVDKAELLGVCCGAPPTKNLTMSGLDDVEEFVIANPMPESQPERRPSFMRANTVNPMEIGPPEAEPAKKGVLANGWAAYLRRSVPYFFVGEAGDRFVNKASICARIPVKCVRSPQAVA